jgi:hypothetical protein
MVSIINARARAGFAALALAGLALPVAAQAQQGSLVAQWGDDARAEASVAAVLNPEERSHYRQLFAAIDAQEWGVVEQLLAQRPDGVLMQAARAEYYTHANSPKVSPEQIAAWFNAGVDLPQAEQIARMGAKRGVSYLPALPQEQGFARQPYAPKRILPRPVSDGTKPGATASAILEAIKADNPTEAQRLLIARIRAILRRTEAVQAPENGGEPTPADIFQRGRLAMDPAKHRVTWNDALVTLTVTEFLILETLAQRPGIVKTRNQLMDAAYQDDVYVDDRTIDSHIKRMRKKFREVDPEFDAIETLYGVGYRYRET